MFKISRGKPLIGILGYGEIGCAIAKFYKRPLIKDLNRDDGLNGVEILHVCIPWSDRFVEILEKEIGAINPGLTIIHSTVAPGTTRKLSDKFFGRVVHSPVRGKHPHLHKSIKIFVKYVGYDDEGAGILAESHLRSIGIKTKKVFSSMTTEVGKLLDTTYYGMCIAWHGEMKNMCNKFGIDFGGAVTEFNKTYNEGYAKMGESKFIRPVLTPPEGIIGGHCVIPNAKILKKYTDCEALDILLKYE